MKTNVCAVVVTYNRLEKLKKALASYSAQILHPKYLVVVNNASTDGTAAFLKEWVTTEEAFQKIVITSTENLGGSGGFYLGQEKAITLDADWIMLADDDAYPEPNYIEGLKCYLDEHNATKISIVCGKVIERGTPVNIHRTYLKSKWIRNFQAYIPQKFYSQDMFEPDFVSYVGILISKQKLEKAGLVNKDYFIWYDDTEHSQRLKKYGKIICIPAYSMIHDVAEENIGLSWKNYYGYRNNVDFFKKHFCLQCPFMVTVLIIKTLLSPLRGVTLTEIRLRLIAIKDGMFGNLGKDSYYKPGWKP